MEDFDIGPLSWVKDEIDQALAQVLEQLAVLAANPADASPLRFAKTHLYQVNGALDMVGLEGCKRYCTEIETVVAKLAQAEITVTLEAIETLKQAIHHLRQYLQDLINGEPDRPLRLSAQLRKIAALQGQVLEDSELFFPDCSVRLPRDIAIDSLEEDAWQTVLNEQRQKWQKALLGWLKGGGQQTLDEMALALERVQQVQAQLAPKTLWWVATAFIDTLAQASEANDAGVKRLCRRIDQELRSASQLDVRINQPLLRDLLYFIAISSQDTPRIVAVRLAFGLDCLLPKSASRVPALDEHEYIRQCQVALEALKDIWQRADSGENVFAAFLNRFGGIVDTYPALSNVSVTALFAAVHKAVTALQEQGSDAQHNDNAMLEVAAALTLLSDALQHYGKQDTEDLLALDRQRALLQALGRGEALPASTDGGQAAQRVLARETAVTLQGLEQSLDAYFRQPDQPDLLTDTATPLAQVLAALDLLDLTSLKPLVLAAGQLIQALRESSLTPSQAVFEALADGLSVVGIYIEQYPHARQGSLVLEDAISRLQAFGPQEIDAPPAEQAAPDSTVAGQHAQGHALPDDELLGIYLEEAEEVLASIAQQLQALRVNATNQQALTEVRRAFHTLKGSGRTVGLMDLGEVAAIVEALLNVVLERKLNPSPELLAYLGDAAAAFAAWVGALREAQSIDVQTADWAARATVLEGQLQQVNAQAALAEEVLIGGTRKISRALYEIFLQEARQHLDQLQDWLQLLLNQDEPIFKPDEDTLRAAHTLASNAGATGFKSLSELARALENWLDVHQGNWTEQSSTLLQNTLDALEKMLAHAAERRQSRTATALLRALKKASDDAGIPVIDAETGSNVVSLAPRMAKAEDAVASLLEAEAEVSEQLESEAHAAAQIQEGLEDSAASEPPPLAPVVGAERDVVVLPPTVSPALTQVDQELFALFIEEANDLMPIIGSELRAWHSQPQEVEHPDILQRALHTLKGSARMAGQGLLGDAVHGMEDHVMRALKHVPQANDFADMFADLDHIGLLLEDALGDRHNLTHQRDLETGRQLNLQRPARERRTQYLRMRADVLDRLINEAGEVSIARSRLERELQEFKQSSQDLTESVQRLRAYLRELEIEAESQLQSRMTLLQESNETFDPLEFDRYTRLQELTRMMAESVNDVSTIQHGLLRNLDESDAALQQQNRMNRELQYGLMNARRVPFSVLSERLHRIVRQTAREVGKQVELVLDGADTEIDRSVLDRMAASLEHLLRNAVAHGVELPETRRDAGKAPLGRITLKLRQENDEILLTISDDGAGVNLEQVRERALASHLLQAEQEISSQTLLALIFEPGFTTATQLSQISGRGVGLDVVRSDITALGGRIDVSSSPGTGAIFSIFLPLTLSVAQAVLVRYGQQQYALPAVMVEQVIKLKPEALSLAHQQAQVDWSGREYPLYTLGRLCGDASTVAEAQRYTPVLLLRSGQYRLALHVDDILGNQEVVMKQIGPQLARVPGMIGATVLGDGAIVLMINPLQLANREALAAGSLSAAVVADPVSQPLASSKARPLALLVDDSLTMRKVLSRFLEREGFDVMVAKDGMEAIQAMQQAVPSVILSDIEMPRMDGFELARHIRDDARTRAVPLIFVSSRTAEKHRTLAHSLGVNAFFGKPVHEEELAAKLKALLH
ncbi:MAG: Hpt domain-containing protein [Methylobacillus glycogenes]|nr:Hpt domain-containing protein [Methylobacillus glycogenes]